MLDACTAAETTKVFEVARDEIYKRMFDLAVGLVATCSHPSPTMANVCANMVASAAEDAIARFRADNPHSFDA